MSSIINLSFDPQDQGILRADWDLFCKSHGISYETSRNLYCAAVSDGSVEIEYEHKRHIRFRAATVAGAALAANLAAELWSWFGGSVSASPEITALFRQRAASALPTAPDAPAVGSIPPPVSDLSPNAVLLTRSLEEMVKAIAAAPMGALEQLAACRECRYRLLYLLDTAPYAGNAARVFAARLRAADDNHNRFHSRPADPHFEAAMSDEFPRIRGLR